MTFISTNKNDQIALLFERDSLNTFKYRIKLLRKWKALPHAYGVLWLDKIESDSIYIFKDANSDCGIAIRIYGDKDEFTMGGQYVRLSGNCKDDSLDIATDDFQKLWHK